MNFEDMQKTWQAQDASAQVTVNGDVLLKEVRRNQHQFWATIFWRDVREVGVCFLLALYFSYHGLRHHDWTDYLLALAGFGVGTFMVVDRLRLRKNQPATNDSLKECVESSLKQVNHQIWLLKNIFWWYLLPIIVALGISFGVSAWNWRHDGVSTAIVFVFCILLCALLYWGVYRLNQFAVRKDLEPRRQELEALLASLK
jgi:Na+/proline symporter